ncbi:MAG: glycosyltransferase family 2 protein [Candidatus Methylomirabilales bacterium]
MRGDPRISVVVLTHDRLPELIRTLTRLRALPERPRLIVVDNASGNGAAGGVAARFPDVELLALHRNMGAAGRNAGLLSADTPYVALCDDDTFWAPGSLARAADHLDEDPHLAVLTARVLVGPDERLDPTCAEMAQSPLCPRPGRPGVPVLGFLAGASLARRDALLAAGGFEPRLFLGGEEWLLAVDLATAGWSLAYAPDVTVHHHPSPARDAARRRLLLARNAIWLAWLRRPARVALRESWRTLCASPGARARLVAEVLRGLSWVAAERRRLPEKVERALRRIEAARRPPE